MRFAHLADTHLGYRQYNLDEREEDFYLVFHEAVDRIIDAECDFVVHSGDLFDDPRPHVRAMVEVMRALEKLEAAGIKFYAIAGNHDVLMRRGAVPPQRLYRSIEFLTPLKPSRVFDGVYICGLPYHSKVHSRALKEGLRKLAAEGKSYEKKILLLHQGVDKYFPLDYELKFNELPKGFDYYALGHVHKRIVDSYGGGKLAYPGATEMWRIDELQDWEEKGKGFFIVDAESFEIEQVNLDVRPFIRAEVGSSPDIEEIKKVLQGARKPVVSITVAAEAHEYQHIYQKLINELKEALYLDIKRRRVEEKGRTVESAVNLRELIREAMGKHSEAERDYAYSLFEALARGDVDEARSLTEDFYEKWSLAPVEPPLKPKAVKGGQTSLEVFR
jgi:DNA repair exonuclease SbcCD nuclease subunit